MGRGKRWENKKRCASDSDEPPRYLKWNVTDEIDDFFGSPWPTRGMSTVDTWSVEAGTHRPECAPCERDAKNERIKQREESEGLSKKWRRHYTGEMRWHGTKRVKREAKHLLLSQHIRSFLHCRSAVPVPMVRAEFMVFVTLVWCGWHRYNLTKSCRRFIIKPCASESLTRFAPRVQK